MTWDTRKTRIILVLTFGLIAFNLGHYVEQAFDGLDGRTIFGIGAWGFGTFVFGWMLIRELGKVEDNG